MKASFKQNKKNSQSIIENDIKTEIRLNKYISQSGFSSRREADRLIEEGLVTIDDQRALVGSKVLFGQVVKVRGEVINSFTNKIYIALHKPTGITTTTDLKDKDNIVEYLNYQSKVFPIGRLDKDSSGLILMTNDGDIVNSILREEYGHDKEYVVSVDKDIDDLFIKRMSNGVKIFNPVSNKMVVTKKSLVTKVNNRTFKIVLTQGLNKQIRRMTKALNYQVVTLKRIRVINIELGNLEVGKYRHLSDSELKVLNDKIKITQGEWLYFNFSNTAKLD